MWAIRILTGPQAGKTYVLKQGVNVVGRAPECDIKLQSTGVSKRHAEIYAFEDKVVINDLGSSNGSFANGVRVKSHQVKRGDKLSFHDIVFAIVPSKISAQDIVQREVANFGNAGPVSSGRPDLRVVEGGDEPSELGDKARAYFDDVVMPGIYKLPEITEFKNVLGLLLLIFVVAVTSFQIMPVIQRLKDSVQKESQRRALTIAKNLEAVNRDPLAKGQTSLLDVSIATREEGVNEALIVSYDQTIIAPASKARAYSTIPFVSEAVKGDDSFVKQIDDSLIGASIPIKAFNPETGTTKPVAFAIIIYNMGTLAIDGGSAFSLFIINLSIALLAGFLLYVFILKLFEYPFKAVNQQLDSALKNGGTSIQVNFLFEPLQSMISNVNSSLARATSTSGPIEQAPLVDRDREAENWLHMMMSPALAIYGANETIMGCNEAFERLTNITSDRIRRQSLQVINDQALRAQLEDLVQNCRRDPSHVAESQLEFPSGTFKIKMIASANGNDIAYFFVTFHTGGM